MLIIFIIHKHQNIPQQADSKLNASNYLR